MSHTSSVTSSRLHLHVYLVNDELFGKAVLFQIPEIDTDVDEIVGILPSKEEKATMVTEIT